jgi:CRISPR-associated protein Csh2
VLVQTVEDDKGKIMTCSALISKISKENKIKEEQLVEYLLDKYIDVKLFGAVITKPKKDIMGPLQITWSRSVHEAEVKFIQGNAAYAGSEGKSQASIWSKYITPYALFKTYGVYNDKVARRQGIKVEEDDLKLFVEGLLDGMKNYRSTSKNQMPRMLVEVIYNNNKIDGELNYIDFIKKVDDLEIRDIGQVEVKLNKLSKYYDDNKENIDLVNIYIHSNLNVEGLHEDFNIKTI